MMRYSLTFGTSFKKINFTFCISVNFCYLVLPVNIYKLFCATIAHVNEQIPYNPTETILEYWPIAALINIHPSLLHNYCTT